MYVGQSAGLKAMLVAAKTSPILTYQAAAGTWMISSTYHQSFSPPPHIKIGRRGNGVNIEMSDPPAITILLLGDDGAGKSTFLS